MFDLKPINIDKEKSNTWVTRQMPSGVAHPNHPNTEDKQI